ncbi:Mcm2-7 hexameric complex component [Cyanidiococcus yangmingshanensis]|uniref:Mcm2-7 hexameric complex component n=1 Tax=Cyanidiococcus yangmingshanensis TaxID=2690220 RepID=A0A7J7IHH7_9RHOD|nr:Mcm2-7 hexameric complex component [Cyanidiococcus yangmingshanensis]
MPLFFCSRSECLRPAGGGGRLIPQYRAFKYSKFQEIRIQEPAQDVPVGSIPRILTVLLQGELSNACAAGDHITVAGIFLPALISGFRALKQGLLSDTYLEATFIRQQKRDYKDYQREIARNQLIQIQIAELAGSTGVYERLARSIAPEIYGHEDVKKALLLQLVGAPSRELSDGMRVRGDIHLCLMGDPGVAKSQLLRYICNVAPRGVYTTGKGSSGVGLTAAVPA